MVATPGHYASDVLVDTSAYLALLDDATSIAGSCGIISRLAEQHLGPIPQTPCYLGPRTDHVQLDSGRVGVSTGDGGLKHCCDSCQGVRRAQQAIIAIRRQGLRTPTL
jgi:hypothetical protein